MTYHIRFTDSVLKTLKKLDHYTQRMLLDWIEKNLEGCQNPKAKGKALSDNRKNQWRYCVGDYRIITLIEEDVLIILVIAIGHRKDIYGNH